MAPPPVPGGGCVFALDLDVAWLTVLITCVRSGGTAPPSDAAVIAALRAELAGARVRFCDVCACFVYFRYLSEERDARGEG